MSKPQRRKGNAKNASSSLAHNLLSDGSFIGLTPEMNVFEMAGNEAATFNHVDDEARIILRKLMKKDACTREKGLRELIQFMEGNPESIEICYDTFIGIVEHLSTDGSATVRLLTMKTISFFINKLKKSAGKGLKTIIPLVIFATCDASNSVGNAAENVFKENFEGTAKRAQLLEMFGGVTIRLAVSLITGENAELCQAAKYDEEESVEQRKYRLEVQGLGTILKLSDESKNVDWVESVSKLFSDSNYLRKVLKGEKYNLKTSLLSVCLKLPNNIEIMMNGPISQWILDCLDSTNDTICDSVWNAFIVLVASEEYLSKTSFQKTIIPRILNVIRKKKSHWSKMATHILPFVATVFEDLQKSNSFEAIIESYFDNLPFDSTISPNCTSQWICSFVEVVQWILSNEKIDENVVEMTVSAIVKMCKESLKTFENHRIASLINWIFEKNILKKSESLRLCQLIEAVILENRENSSKFAEILLASAKFSELVPIHSTLLILDKEKENNWVELLDILEHSEDSYFEHVLARLPSSSKLGEPTSKWSENNAKTIAKLIVRIVKKSPEKSFEPTNNFVWREILLILANSCSKTDEIWNIFGFSPKNKELFEEMISSWREEGNGDAVAKMIDFLKIKNIEIEQKLKNVENLEYLLDLLKNCESLKGDSELIYKIFNKVFRVRDYPGTESLKLLANNLPENFEIPGFFEDLMEKDGNENTAMIFDMILRNSKNSEGMIRRFLIQEKDVEKLLDDVKFLEVERFCTASTSCTISIPYEINGHFDVMKEEKICEFLNNKTRLAFVNISSEYATNASKVYASIILNLVKILENRFEFSEIPKYYIREISDILSKSVIDFQPFLPPKSTILADVYLSQKGGKLEHLIEDQEILELSYSFGLESDEFLEKMKEEMEELAFFGERNCLKERLTGLLVARAFLAMADKVLLIADEKRELVDYLLCGLVTVLDNVNDELLKCNQLPIILESLAFYYLRIFAKINKFANETNHITPIIDEWKEFYLPTITRLIFNWFGIIKSGNEPNPFVRSLFIALNEISNYPNDFDEIESIREFSPELDAFNYSQTEQSIISHSFSLLESENQYIQLIGLKMAKLTMPLMFKKENILTDEKNEEEVLNAEKTLKIPEIINRKLLESLETGKWSVVMLFDICLVPFESDLLKNELRVLYCDALQTFIRPCLSTLIIKQPAAIPRSKEESYYLQDSSIPSIRFFDKYACRLLFRTISFIPAAVRLWFKSLPQSATETVKKTITNNASRLLVEKELERVKLSKYANGGDVDMKIRVIPVTGEIVAEYLVEETKMKLTIGLPPDFPLSVPTLHLDKAIVQSDRARKWLVQLNAYLFHQNGAIVEGIELWRNNVDKGVQGAEACCICMMTIHSNSHQLPKVKCKQCKNKFHSNCLYKWFESSNQSSCPLCRANFT
ncbi:unnamed protein product [Caenorhabditis angaria]|uniref:E3 ubiquitin-protein ligase listerin n=1 Tax=Caenorhabditis angaria TaxID=860376 RepID=A0A9P1I4N6_9PELO|nr:unnamed protein product [Caenorhabditis angaria]